MKNQKISAVNAPQFVAHLQNLAKLAGADHPYSFGIWAMLTKLERQASRITTAECNGTISEEAAEIKLQKIRERVAELLPNAKTFFINGDPRGYALKIKEEEAKEIGLYQDWGGYGILAPEF